MPRPPPSQPPNLSPTAPRPTYDRARDLPRLVPLWPWELADRSLEGQKRLVARLERALRDERRRGVAGHWTYDIVRHAEILAALKAERAALQPCTA